MVGTTYGGTGLSSYTAGDLIYSNATNTLTNLNIGTTGQTLIVSGGAPVWGSLDLAGSGVSGVLPEVHGGTNQSSYVTGDLLYGSATNTLSKLAPNTTTTKKWLNQTGTGSAGQAPTWDVITASDIASGVLGAANGGTGLSSYAVGDIVYASGTTTLSKLNAVATGNALISGGLTTAPSWGKIDLTTTVTGTLPVANGGTGVTTSTGSGSVVLSTSPALVTPALGTPTSGDFSSGTFTWPTFNQNTTGTAAGLSSTLAVTSGGTGQTSYTDGQLLIGNSTGNTLNKSTLTAGTGISITNGGGSITIASTVNEGLTITDDTSTASALYPTFTSATTGTITGESVSSTQLKFTPSTGELASPELYASNGMLVHSATVATSYAIPNGANAIAAGPVTVASGATVTIPSGSRWLVL